MGFFGKIWRALKPKKKKPVATHKVSPIKEKKELQMRLMHAPGTPSFKTWIKTATKEKVVILTVPDSGSVKLTNTKNNSTIVLTVNSFGMTKNRLGELDFLHDLANKQAEELIEEKKEKAKKEKFYQEIGWKEPQIKKAHEKSAEVEMLVAQKLPMGKAKIGALPAEMTVEQAFRFKEDMSEAIAKEKVRGKKLDRVPTMEEIKKMEKIELIFSKDTALRNKYANAIATLGMARDKSLEDIQRMAKEKLLELKTKQITSTHMKIIIGVLEKVATKEKESATMRKATETVRYGYKRKLDADQILKGLKEMRTYGQTPKKVRTVNLRRGKR